MSEKTLAAKVAAAVKAVGDLAPDKINQTEHFAYRSADLILSRCGQALAAEGVVVIPAVEEALLSIGESSKGVKRYEALVKFKFVVTDGVTEWICPFSAAGVDFSSPDRAVAKATTLGHKYFLAKLLCVGVGNEDAEADVEPPSPPAQARRPAPSPSAPSRVRQETRLAADVEELIAQWATPLDAYAWAVRAGAFADQDAARAAFRSMVEREFGGSLNTGNLATAFGKFVEIAKEAKNGTNKETN